MPRETPDAFAARHPCRTRSRYAGRCGARSDKNKNAIYLTVECESGDIQVATIAHNAAVGAQIVGGGTLITAWVDVFDNPEFAGEPLFSFGNRGFQNTGLETETCVIANNPMTPGLFARVEALIVP